MLRPTYLGRTEGLWCLSGVVVQPDLRLFDQAVEAGYIREALALVPIKVAPEQELVVAEAAGEPGARLPPREPLLQARLAGSAAELHGVLPHGPRDPIASHVGYCLFNNDYYN